jgi:diguanylate cyclase (GGDEF)-like protein
LIGPSRDGAGQERRRGAKLDWAARLRRRAAEPRDVVKGQMEALARSARTGFGTCVPPAMGEICVQQAKSLRIMACALSVCGTNAVVLVTAAFATQVGAAGHMIAAAVISVYCLWVLLAYFLRRHGIFLRASIALLILQGSLWGLLVCKLASVAVGQQASFVVTIALGLVSTPVLSAPFSVAMAFWIPVALGCEVAIAGYLPGHSTNLSATVFGYELLVLSGIFLINRNLMQLMIARVNYRIQNETIRLLLKDYEENASDWLWETDAALKFQSVTSRFARVLQLTPDRIEGRTLDEIAAKGDESAQDYDVHAVSAAMNGHDPFMDLPIRLSVGEEDKWLLFTGRPIIDASGGFAGYRGVGSDITATRRAAEETLYLATHDALTGLGNRRMFIERLEKACACALDRHVRTFALLMLDLDGFKEVNDDHGHASGDAVLRETANRLSLQMRPGDVVARLGGDEFAVLMLESGVREAAVKAERLIETVSRPIRLQDTWVSVGASVGVATFPRDGHTSLDMMRNADLALYRAKDAGRGVWRIFEASFGAEFQDKVALLAELRVAIISDFLQIDYQPIIDVKSTQVVSMEALCRWTHPERGAIPPSVFIPLAEECGLIRSLGSAILTVACRDAMDWAQDISVSVNMSPIQLKDLMLVDVVRSVLQETGLDPSRLEIEITESALLKADRQTRQHLNALIEMGIRIVLDDFGTGFSSLSTLRNFRFHGLKIDAEFVRNIEADPKAEAILRLVAAMAEELGVSLTVEGIETEGQLKMIQSFGIAKAQGYLLGTPRRYVASQSDGFASADVKPALKTQNS